MEKRAKHKQKWNESKVIEKHFYNKALRRGSWLFLFFFFVHEMKVVWKKWKLFQKKWSACSEQPSSYGARGRLLRTKEAGKSRTRRDNNTEARVDM